MDNSLVSSFVVYNVNKTSTMRMHHATTKCKHCSQEMAFAITTIGTRRTKLIIFLDCEACGLRFQGQWDSRPELETKNEEPVPGPTKL